MQLLALEVVVLLSYLLRMLVQLPNDQMWFQLLRSQLSSHEVPLLNVLPC
jgi:hypothetical protein